MLSCFSRILLSATPWTKACQAPHGDSPARIHEWIVIKKKKKTFLLNTTKLFDFFLNQCKYLNTL